MARTPRKTWIICRSANGGHHSPTLAFNSKDSRIESWNFRSKGKNFRFSFHSQKGHWAETEFTNIEWFPHLHITGDPTPQPSEEDPIRPPPASSSQSNYNIGVKGPSDSNCSIKIAFDINFFLDNHENSVLF